MVRPRTAEHEQLYCFTCDNLKENMEKLPVALLVCWFLPPLNVQKDSTYCTFSVAEDVSADRQIPVS